MLNSNLRCRYLTSSERLYELIFLTYTVAVDGNVNYLALLGGLTNYGLDKLVSDTERGCEVLRCPVNNSNLLGTYLAGTVLVFATFKSASLTL